MGNPRPRPSCLRSWWGRWTTRAAVSWFPGYFLKSPVPQPRCLESPLLPSPHTLLYALQDGPTRMLPRPHEPGGYTAFCLFCFQPLAPETQTLLHEVWQSSHVGTDTEQLHMRACAPQPVFPDGGLAFPFEALTTGYGFISGDVSEPWVKTTCGSIFPSAKRAVLPALLCRADVGQIHWPQRSSVCGQSYFWLSCFVNQFADLLLGVIPKLSRVLIILAFWCVGRTEVL